LIELRKKQFQEKFSKKRGLKAIEITNLNVTFEYKSLGKECTEHAYMTKVDNIDIKLNEEHIEYEWLYYDKFIEKIEWFGDKRELEKILDRYIIK
jgi:hypothetical protein